MSYHLVTECVMISAPCLLADFYYALCFTAGGLICSWFYATSVQCVVSLAGGFKGTLCQLSSGRHIQIRKQNHVLFLSKHYTFTVNLKSKRTVSVKSTSMDSILEHVPKTIKLPKKMKSSLMNLPLVSQFCQRWVVIPNFLGLHSLVFVLTCNATLHTQLSAFLVSSEESKWCTRPQFGVP